MSVLSRVAAGTVLATALVTPAVAAAQTATPPSQRPPPPRIQDEIGRGHFETGLRYFEIGRFEDAAREFQRAYEASPQPDLLFNLGRAHEGAGQLQAAADAFQRYLDSGAPPEDREALTARVAALRSRVVAGAPAAPVASATSAASVASPSSAVLAPAPHVRTRTLYEHRPLNAIGPFVALGIGIALVGVSTWQAVDASRHVSAIDAVNRGERTWSADVDSAYRATGGELTAAYAFGIAGGAAALGGLLWFLTRGPGERREVVVGATVAPAPGGVVLGIGGAL